MAEVVGSAVVGEAVSRILSSLLSGGGADDAADCSSEIKLERLDMAVLKLETVVAVSEGWKITHPPLLHWKAKLELVAEEGRDILRAARGGRSTTQQQRRRRRQGMRISSSSFRLRVARAARRFVPFIRGGPGGAGGGGDELSEATVRRFERLADGADSFLELVERAGSRRPKVMVVHFVPALSQSSLAAGKAMELSVRMGGGTAVILLQPWWLNGGDDEGGVGEAGRKTAACLWMSYEHDTAWEKNLKLMAAFHLTESSSMDIMRIAMDLVELLPSQQFSAARASMKELVAEMSFHGRNSPAPSAVYTSFIRAIQNTHRYGFEPAANRGTTSTGRDADADGTSPLPEQVLMICAHCYLLPPPGRSAPPVELVWHSSPHYLPKKLSEQHEPLVSPQQIQPELLTGVTTDGLYQQHGRQWWCPRTSTRLSMAPTTCPPKGVLQWYREKARSSAGVGATADCNTSVSFQ